MLNCCFTLSKQKTDENTPDFHNETQKMSLGFLD